MYVDDALKPEWAFPEAFTKMVKNSMPEVEFETLSNFLLRNRGRGHLQIWDRGVNYVLATESDLLGDSMGQFWTNFRTKFPNSGGFLILF